MVLGAEAIVHFEFDHQIEHQDRFLISNILFHVHITVILGGSVHAQKSEYVRIRQAKEICRSFDHRTGGGDLVGALFRM